MLSKEDLFLSGLQEVKTAEQKPIEEAPKDPGPGALTSRRLFTLADASPIVLDLVLIKKYGMDWMTWLPDTVFHEIETDFQTSISTANKLKIMAVQNLHVIDTFWDKWEVFEKSIHCLNGVQARLDLVQPPNLEQLYHGVDIATELRKEDFHDEVSRYIAACFKYAEVSYAADPLGFAQPYLSDSSYTCLDCNKTNSILPPFNGTCSYCSGQYEGEHKFSLEPNQERVRKGFGSNLKFFDKIPYAGVKTTFERLMKMTPMQAAQDVKEHHEDIEAFRLYTAVRYMEAKRKDAQTQLAQLKTWLDQ